MPKIRKASLTDIKAVKDHNAALNIPKASLPIGQLT